VQARRGSAGRFTRPAKSCCGCDASSAKLLVFVVRDPALALKRRERLRIVFRRADIGTPLS
jgi:hypothetical protein